MLIMPFATATPTTKSETNIKVKMRMYTINRRAHMLSALLIHDYRVPYVTILLIEFLRSGSIGPTGFLVMLVISNYRNDANGPHDSLRRVKLKLCRARNTNGVFDLASIR
jgi:hypothetical protein